MPAPQNLIVKTPLHGKIENKKSKKTKSAFLTKFLENIDTFLEPANKFSTDQNNFKIDFITFEYIFENNQGYFNPLTPTIYNEYNIAKEDLLDIIMSIIPSLHIMVASKTD